ncbi:hypothetical protein BKA56DRAFT_605697 [Ilyonectria sp. MPI-CAGE-AT-0026]|nr:hypothetical protein BKA56DRAFT_605697 [Ilyonectria sp. MPI-CAGE-AT-0026]
MHITSGPLNPDDVVEMPNPSVGSQLPVFAVSKVEEDPFTSAIPCTSACPITTTPSIPTPSVAPTTTATTTTSSTRGRAWLWPPPGPRGTSRAQRWA